MIKKTWFYQKTSNESDKRERVFQKEEVEIAPEIITECNSGNQGGCIRQTHSKRDGIGNTGTILRNPQKELVCMEESSPSIPPVMRNGRRKKSERKKLAQPEQGIGKGEACSVGFLKGNLEKKKTLLKTIKRENASIQFPAIL